MEPDLFNWQDAREAREEAVARAGENADAIKSDRARKRR